MLWQYCRDELMLENDSNIGKFPDNPDSASFKYKQKITG